MEGAKEAGHAIEKINLNDLNIHFLTSQDYTDLSGASEAPDDAPMIVGKMLSADVIVMATPVFFYAMSGQLKTMIDRTYERHKEMENKEFYFIIAGADKNKEKFQPVVLEFRGFLEALKNPIERGIIYGTGAWEKGSVEQTPAMDEAFEMGKNI
jgi:multimeric flavodoxin WrbA